MKKTENKIIAKIFILFFLLIISFSVIQSVFAAGELVPCGVGTDAEGKGKADCTLCHLVIGFNNIYNYFFAILLAATTLVVVVAGVMYMVSSGDKGMIEKAKSALTYALTAMILALTAWLIINATLSALGYTKVSNWWTFSCDTTQTVGPTPPGPTPPPPTPGTPIPGGTGDCGGVKVSGVQACDKTTKALDDLLSCIKGKTGVTAALIESRSALENCAGSNYRQPPCVHIENSCHYGGRNCPGQINAADVYGNLPGLRDAAVACGGFAAYNGKTYYPSGKVGTIDDHTEHVHISPVGNCGCQ
jgi:hypothetical protein